MLTVTNVRGRRDAPVKASIEREIDSILLVKEEKAASSSSRASLGGRTCLRTTRASGQPAKGGLAGQAKCPGKFARILVRTNATENGLTYSDWVARKEFDDWNNGPINSVVAQSNRTRRIRPRG